MPQYNAQRVMHKFIGTQQSFTDGIGEWRNLVWTSSVNGATLTTQFMATGGFILFKGTIDNSAGKVSTWTANLPSDIKSPSLFTSENLNNDIRKNVDGWVPIKTVLNGNEIQLTTNSLGGVYPLENMVLNYKI